jgi:hypothetical protein
MLSHCKSNRFFLDWVELICVCKSNTSLVPVVAVVVGGSDVRSNSCSISAVVFCEAVRIIFNTLLAFETCEDRIVSILAGLNNKLCSVVLLDFFSGVLRFLLILNQSECGKSIFLHQRLEVLKIVRKFVVLAVSCISDVFFQVE